MGAKLGGASNPLLVSVRSGAPVSMPGMMDTILNLGLNDRSVDALDRGHRRRPVCPRLLPAADPDVRKRRDGRADRPVRGPARANEAEAWGDRRRRPGRRRARPSWCSSTRSSTAQRPGIASRRSPREQLDLAVEAVFKSWNTPRAVAYRRREHIADDMGTAVNVQQMVFGNTGERSGTGVALHPQPVHRRGRIPTASSSKTRRARTSSPGSAPALPTRRAGPARAGGVPRAGGGDGAAREPLRRHAGPRVHRRSGRLYMLQTRSGKRDPRAALRIAVDMVAEGVIDRRMRRLRRVDANLLEHVLRPTVNPRDDHPVIATGLPACAGAAVGVVVFDAATADGAGRRRRIGGAGAGRDVGRRRARHGPGRRVWSPAEAA